MTVYATECAFEICFAKRVRVCVLVVTTSTVVHSRLTTGQISLPKLEDFDWRLDFKAASDTLGRLSAPAVFLQLKVRLASCLAVCTRRSRP